MSDVVEERLQRLLHEQAGSVAADLDPLPGVEMRSRRLVRRRRLAAVAVLAATATIAVSATLLYDPSPRAADVPVGVPSTSLAVSVVAPTPTEPMPTNAGNDAAPMKPMISVPAGPADPAAASTPLADVVRKFLETSPSARQDGNIVAGFGGQIFCGIEVLGESPDRTRAYVWALCQEFYGFAGAVSAGSGSSQAVLVSFTGTASDRRINGVRFPPIGAGGKEMRALFPADIADRVLSRNGSRTDQEEPQLRARAEAAAPPAGDPSTQPKSWIVVVAEASSATERGALERLLVSPAMPKPTSAQPGVWPAKACFPDLPTAADTTYVLAAIANTQAQAETYRAATGRDARIVQTRMTCPRD